jgi:hypothetical protein
MFFSEPNVSASVAVEIPRIQFPQWPHLHIDCFVQSVRVKNDMILYRIGQEFILVFNVFIGNEKRS